MALGRRAGQGKLSPIIRAIQSAEHGTTCEIRVHLSKRWFEPDAHRRARRIFDQYNLSTNGVLLYVNLRRRKFAIIADLSVHEIVKQRYWNELSLMLSEDLHSTFYENAIAMAVRTLGFTMKRYFSHQPTSDGTPDDLV